MKTKQPSQAELRARIATLEAKLAAATTHRADGESHDFRDIADAMPVMISYLDADCRFRFVNRAYEQWFGRSVAQIEGQHVGAIMDAETYAARQPFVARALAGEQVRYEVDFPLGGECRKTIVEHVPHVRDGKVVGFYAFVQDVTDQWLTLETLRESEQRFRRIADSIPAPIWVTGPDRLRAFANKAYVDFLGTDPAAALVFDWRLILHPDDRERVTAESLAGEASGERFTLEGRYRRVDGSWRWLRSVSQPRFDARGMPDGFVGVAEDITTEKEAAELAAKAATVLQARVHQRTSERDRLWALSRDGFMICDLSGVWLSASPAWTALLGWPEDQLLGRTAEWMEHPDDIARTRAVLRGLLHGTSGVTFTNRLRAADGGYRWLAWNAVVDGDRVYAIARDVTDERNRTETLDRTREALRQAQKLEALGQLTGGVAHDFNNLLTPILGGLDLIARRGLPDPRSARLVDAALQSADRAKTLVQRLLTFARRQRLDPRPIALGTLLRGMEDLLRSTLGPAITLDFALAPGLPVAIADPNQLEMAVLNLAVNARDAMPGGGTLTISLDRESIARADADLPPGAYLKLGVADTGTGMDAATLRRAIEPFFSTKEQGAGTGLGLSMAHGLTAQLGGALRITSTPGAGTRIDIMLPIVEGRAEAVKAPAAPPRQHAPLRIILVDDEPLARTSTAAMLAELGHHVVECPSGAEALATLGRGIPADMIVTDQLMPRMSGAELVRTARADHPRLHALVISGYAAGTDPLAGLHCLAKPFTAGELEAALAAAIGA
ncbi:PAS domain S-box protein [Sphingomonas flavalba]|uniref:PAS domain S-box protein n=1 Tax=Sphingomonas flavalba TaxID=2559804 RepID=UPI0039E1D40B